MERRLKCNSRNISGQLQATERVPQILISPQVDHLFPTLTLFIFFIHLICYSETVESVVRLCTFEQYTVHLVTKSPWLTPHLLPLRKSGVFHLFTSEDGLTFLEEKDAAPDLSHLDVKTKYFILHVCSLDCCIVYFAKALDNIMIILFFTF